MVSLRRKVRDLESQWKKILARGTYASVSVTLAEEQRATLPWNSSRSLLFLRNSSIEGVGAILSSVTACLGFLLHYGPSLLLWGAVAYGIFWTIRRFRHKEGVLHQPA